MLTTIKSYFSGFTATFTTLLVITIAIALTQHYQTIIISKASLINQLLPLSLAATALVAAQFNHSRLTLMCSLWLGLLLSERYQLAWQPWLTQHGQWLMLSVCAIMLVLSPIKDRGLLSVHGVIRIVVITLIAALCWGWLYVCQRYLPELAFPHQTLIKPHIPLHLPLAIIAIALLWQSLRHRCLTRAAILTTAICYYLHNNQWLTLDWQLLTSIFVVHYLLVVLIDSYLLAYQDDLTGLPSRRALNQLALSLGCKYTVAMMDIDHFKKFNDTYGHDIGDQVLKLVASKLSKIKGGGKVFRYGGEEFTVVFPRKSVEQTIEYLEQLRQSIADYKMVVRQPVRQNKKARGNGPSSKEKTVSVTISIGVAQRQAKQSFEQTLKQADVALYQAKKNGRNNVSY